MYTIKKLIKHNEVYLLRVKSIIKQIKHKGSCPINK